MLSIWKKNLEIPMCYSDSVNRERTDNAMTQRKGIKSRQCNDPKKRDKEQTMQWPKEKG